MKKYVLPLLSAAMITTVFIMSSCLQEEGNIEDVTESDKILTISGQIPESLPSNLISTAIVIFSGDTAKFSDTIDFVIDTLNNHTVLNVKISIPITERNWNGTLVLLGKQWGIIGLGNFQIDESLLTDRADAHVSVNITQVDQSIRIKRPYDITDGDSIVLCAEVYNNYGGTIEQYDWKFGTDEWFTTRDSDTILIPKAVGSYNCSLRVTDGNGITFSCAVIFSVKENYQLVDDFSDRTNQNELEFFWFYYDDNCRLGTNDRPQSLTPGTPSVITVPFTEGPRQAFGLTTDRYKVKTYTFVVDTEPDGNDFGTLPFSFGSTWPVTNGDAQPYVGIGTMLNAEGKYLDISGTTSIKFKMRSHQNELTVHFMISEFQVDTFSNKPIPPERAFSYHGVDIDVTPDWKEYEIQIPLGVDYPGDWAPDFGPLNLMQCTKLIWEISGEDNPGIKTDTLDVDDIYIMGYRHPVIHPGPFYTLPE